MGWGFNNDSFKNATLANINNNAYGGFGNFMGPPNLSNANTYLGNYAPTGMLEDKAKSLVNNIGTKAGDGIDWFGKNGVLGNTFAGLEALSGLGNAYAAYKNYKLAKKQFGLEKAFSNRSIANQAKIINNTYDNAAQVAAGMIGSRNANGTYGFTDPNITRRYEDNAKKKYVDGSPIA